jgi:hypothetical protein
MLGIMRVFKAARTGDMDEKRSCRDFFSNGISTLVGLQELLFFSDQEIV